LHETGLHKNALTALQNNPSKDKPRDSYNKNMHAQTHPEAEPTLPIGTIKARSHQDSKTTRRDSCGNAEQALYQQSKSFSDPQQQRIGI
jgi:hypothetical protein